MTHSILLVGAGRMGGALLKGWLKRALAPLIVVEPLPSPELRKLAGRGVTLLKTIEEAPAKLRACVVALKPQVLKSEAPRLAPIAQSGTLMISIAAGTNVTSLRQAWGDDARIVRAMPNTPGAIGEGISALYAAPGTTAKDRKLAESLLAALGQTVWVARESDIDAVTAVSGSGPAYVFLLVEALAEAARREDLPNAIALKLARQTVIGSGALLKSDPSPAERLRRNVTSPGGTTEAALEILLGRDGLKSLIARAVRDARRRAKQLGS
jgi:pyrroline-5-carboxylate reductase